MMETPIYVDVLKIVGIWIALLMMLFSLGWIIALFEKSLERQYSSSEYRLEIKVTEFQGVKDTTYVLIPKED